MYERNKKAEGGKRRDEDEKEKQEGEGIKLQKDKEMKTTFPYKETLT